MATPGATPAATKKGPDFGIRPVQVEGDGGLPDDPERTRAAGYAEIKENLTAIQATPNTWFEVAHYSARNGSDKNPTGAKKVVAKFLGGDIKPPPAVDPEVKGEYDLEYRKASYDGSSREGSVVLARYIVGE